MSTPIGHCIGGVGIYLLSKKKNTPDWLLILYSIIVSNLPDIDFICITNSGIKFSGIYHHQITHSITFIVILSLVALIAGGRRLGIITFWCLTIHNLIDYFTFDGIPPKGIMFLAPFSKEYFISPIALWYGNKHQTLWETISIPSLISMGYDLITMGLIVLIVVILKKVEVKVEVEVKQKASTSTLTSTLKNEGG
ncbi:MAG: metal-dependent hydrolase [Nitrospirota bacterium]